MQTTTPRAIRSDFRTQILAITPVHAEHADKPWCYVHSKNDVPGSEIRTFALEQGVAFPFGDFVHGDGRDYDYELKVWTSYAGLSEEDDDSIISEDSVQLHAQLVQRYDPALPGLMHVVPQGWEEGDESEDGRRYGAHVFTVRYFAPHQA